MSIQPYFLPFFSRFWGRKILRKDKKTRFRPRKKVRINKKNHTFDQTKDKKKENT